MTKTNTSRANSVQANINSGIGAFVWWDFDSISVEPGTMQAVLDKHGVPITVPVIDVENVIRKAASGFSLGGRSKTKFKAAFVQTDAAGLMEIGILRYEKTTGAIEPGKEKVAWRQCDTVVFDKNTSTWFYRGVTPAAAAFVKAASAKVEFLGHEFVRDTVVMGTLNALGAFPLRRRLGGFYFVPALNLEAVQKVADVLHDLPAECALNIATVSSDSGTMASVSRSARDHVGNRVNELMEKIDLWKDAARCPHSDAVDSAMKDFAELRDHADLYATALGVQLGDLQGKMEEAVKAANVIVTAITKGLPPGLLTVIRDFTKKPGLGVEITFEELRGTQGLTDAAYGERAAHYWGKGRGHNAAVECGYKTVVTETGVAFMDPKAVEAPPAETPEEAPEATEPQGDAAVVSMVKAMPDAKLRNALALVTGEEPAPNLGRPDMEARYLEAVGA